MKTKQIVGQKQTRNLHLKVDDGLLEVVMEIGRERAKILGAMKNALLRGDDGAAHLNEYLI